MATTATNTFNQNRLHEAVAGTGKTIAVKLPASVTYAAGTILGELIGNNEVVTLTEGTNITAGTFTLTFGGQTTSALQHDATAATVQAALEALSTIGAGNITVTGGLLTSTPFTLTFKNLLGNTNVGAVTSDQASLTGTFTIAVATAGSAGTPGTFSLYSSSATNGAQFPKAILEWGVTTDSNGMIVAENGSTERTASAYWTGCFKASDVPTMTDTILALMLGRFIQGGCASGATYPGIFTF